MNHPEHPTAEPPALPPTNGAFAEQPTRVPAVVAAPAATVGLAPPAADAALMPAAADVPGYEILGELGRGGMGVVYQARQLKLNRVVALKMILTGGHAAAADRARFLAEAEAVAHLQHPNIVQLFEAGEHRGLPFFTLEFVPGGSLADKVRAAPLPPREAARLVEQLAHGMAYAHARGVVHRDLKPENVLLAADGTPKVTDFGLAKRVEGGAGLTRTGAVLGTPSYMAPEQAGGKGEEVGPAADIYALGAVLYRLLTGRPPFQAATPLDTVLQVVSDEPVPPTRLQPQVPRDLETITLKCLQKEPPKRYASAAALAEDLRRFQAGEPIRARPVGRWERAAKWVRRRPAVAGLLAAVALVALAGAGGIAWAYGMALDERDLAQAETGRADQEAREALAEKRRADEQLTRAEWQVYAGKIREAQLEWEANNASVAHIRLKECRRDFRGWEYDYLWALFYRNQQTLHGHTGAVKSVCYSPDGKRLASADGTVKVWDVATGKELLTLRGQNRVLAVSYSPDGKRLATASWDKTVQVWDAATGKEVRTLRGHMLVVSSVCYRPDGKCLASASWDGTVKVWDAATGKELRTLRGHTKPVNAVSYSPDGKRLTSASYDKTVKIWDTGIGQEVLTLRGHTFLVNAVSNSPDGKRLATASEDGTVKVWDMATGKELRTLRGHTKPVNAVSYSPDGKHLASASRDETVKVWDAATGKEVRTLRGHTFVVNAVSYSPDGKHLATASWDGTVKIWDTATRQEILTLRGHTEFIWSVCYSPDGKRLASASADKTVKVWDAATGKELHTLRGHAGLVQSVCYSPDGKRLASASWDQTVKVWDAATGQEIRTLRGHTDMVVAVCYSRDGKRLASASADKAVKVWDTAIGQEVLTLRGHTVGLSLCFSPDGKHLASADTSMDGTVTVKFWDARKVP